MRTYTLKETAKIINVPTSTIKQWEKDLDGLLTIPRSKQGARIYSEIEIDLLLEIKHWVSNKLGKAEIRELLEEQQAPSEPVKSEEETTIPVFSNEEISNIAPDEEISNIASDEEKLPDIALQEQEWSDLPLQEEELPDIALHDEGLTDVSVLEVGFTNVFLHEEAVSDSSLHEEGLSEIPLELTKWNQEQFFLAMDQYKKTFLNEVKNEIRSVVRTEVVEEVKKEISKENVHTVKKLSDSIYKASANMQDEMKELSFTVQKATDITDKTINKLERTINEQSLETSEEFFTISKQLAETSEDLSHYIDVTNREIGTLSEAIEAQNAFLIEDQEKFRYEVRQREIAFQDMLTNFREAASAKEKKWWKFW